MLVCEMQGVRFAIRKRDEFALSGVATRRDPLRIARDRPLTTFERMLIKYFLRFNKYLQFIL